MLISKEGGGGRALQVCIKNHDPPRHLADRLSLTPHAHRPTSIIMDFQDFFDGLECGGYRPNSTWNVMTSRRAVLWKNALVTFGTGEKTVETNAYDILNCDRHKECDEYGNYYGEWAKR